MSCAKYTALGVVMIPLKHNFFFLASIRRVAAFRPLCSPHFTLPVGTTWNVILQLKVCERDAGVLLCGVSASAAREKMHSAAGAPHGA